MSSAASSGAAADFVRRFEEFWAAPRPELLRTVLAAEVRLVAPLTPTTRTLAEGERSFADLFSLIPDLTAEVQRWGATGDGVLIEFTARGTLAGRGISWRAVDRFTLDENGLASERVSYFDSAPLALALATRPRAWPDFAAAQLHRLRR